MRQKYKRIWFARADFEKKIKNDQSIFDLFQSLKEQMDISYTCEIDAQIEFLKNYK